MMTFYVLQQRGVGMSEPLVDKDGYPRNDIDVYSVRKARHDINCMYNVAKYSISYLSNFC
jgi:26S proteasome non-ATPase regulatory subunit 9